MDSTHSQNEMQNDTHKANELPLSANELREKVLMYLKEVIDPEIHINIVDLGLIYRIDISDDFKTIEIDFTLTTPGCPLADVIEDDIQKAVHKASPQSEVVSTLVWTPMWNADFMSEDARLELGFPI